MVFQSNTGGLPDEEAGVDYAEKIGEPGFPVLADMSEQVIYDTPYEGNTLPGKCVLTPDMVMLSCTSGHGNEDLYDAIREHAGL